MLNMTQAAAPSPSSGRERRPATGTMRILGLDAARAVAIVGMIAVNVGPRTGEGPAAFLYHLPLGRASLLFMLLAGIGMSILTRSARRPGGAFPWKQVLWRAVFLLVSGLALQLLDHEVSVILPTYGLLFLLCLPLLQAPTPVLAATAAVAFAAGPVAWIGILLASGRQPNFIPPSLLDSPPDILEGIALSGAYPAIVWCVPFLVGLVLGRMDLANRAVQRLLLAWGAAAAVGGYLLSRLLVLWFGEPADALGWDRLVSAVNHSQMPLWLLSGIGSAAFVLGLFLRAERFVSRKLGFLVSAGRLSLTIYVGHLVLLAFMVRPEPHYLSEGIAITTAMSVLFFVFASCWTDRFRTGPLEALLRWPPSKDSR
jgi:uncharacterized membrane protein YeiB